MGKEPLPKTLTQIVTRGTFGCLETSIHPGKMWKVPLAMIYFDNYCILFRRHRCSFGLRRKTSRGGNMDSSQANTSAPELLIHRKQREHACSRAQENWVRELRVTSLLNETNDELRAQSRQVIPRAWRSRFKDPV